MREKKDFLKQLFCVPTEKILYEILTLRGSGGLTDSSRKQGVTNDMSDIIVKKPSQLKTADLSNSRSKLSDICSDLDTNPYGDTYSPAYDASRLIETNSKASINIFNPYYDTSIPEIAVLSPANEAQDDQLGEVDLNENPYR